MKKLFLTALLAIGLCSVGYSQTSTNQPNSLWTDALNSLGSITNYAVAPYFTHAPDAPTKNGGGVLVLYNINQYVGAGLGIDWLGHFSLVSGNIELRLPTRPLAFIGLSNIVATPFVLGALGTSVSGTGLNNGNVSTVEAAGLNVDFLKIKDWELGAGYAYANWTDAGLFSGRHHEIFLKISKGF